MRALHAEPSAVSRWRHARAIALLPVMNAVVIPAVIVLAAGAAAAPYFSGSARAVVIAIGAVCAAGGAALVVRSIGLFVRCGEGTLAPWDPPRSLVVTGLYRYCRNPMKAGLFLTLLGEALLLQSLPLLAWFACFAGANVAYVRLSEEPGLRRRFGSRYAEYARNVPRWRPRRSPWCAGAAREAKGR